MVTRTLWTDDALRANNSASFGRSRSESTCPATMHVLVCWAKLNYGLAAQPRGLPSLRIACRALQRPGNMKPTPVQAIHTVTNGGKTKVKVVSMASCSRSTVAIFGVVCKDDPDREASAMAPACFCHHGTG